jgi:hypothetical protein
MERLLVTQMQARGHEGTALIYRESDGKWLVRLRALRGTPFRNILPGGCEYAFSKDRDISEAFREALRHAHGMENPADYSAWFEDEAIAARRAAERREEARERILGDEDLLVREAAP